MIWEGYELMTSESQIKNTPLRISHVGHLNKRTCNMTQIPFKVGNIKLFPMSSTGKNVAKTLGHWSRAGPTLDRLTGTAGYSMVSPTYRMWSLYDSILEFLVHVLNPAVSQHPTVINAKSPQVIWLLEMAHERIPAASWAPTSNSFNRKRADALLPIRWVQHTFDPYSTNNANEAFAASSMWYPQFSKDKIHQMGVSEIEVPLYPNSWRAYFMENPWKSHA